MSWTAVFWNCWVAVVVELLEPKVAVVRASIAWLVSPSPFCCVSCIRVASARVQAPEKRVNTVDER